MKAGISVTDVEKCNEGLGWFVGPMLDVSLPLVGFSVDVSALYYQVKYFMIGSSPQLLKRKGVWMSLAYLF